MGYKSYSQKKRESYDYRGNYIKHNKGFFGGIYVCSQCLSILSREEMEVDHIFPVSKWYGINRTFNCTSICSKCNKSKSNHVTLSMTAKGVSMKIIEELYLLIQKLLLWVMRLLLVLLIMLLRILVRPLKTDRSLIQKGAIVSFYVIAIRFIFLLLI